MGSSVAKRLSVRLRTKWLWVRIPFAVTIPTHQYIYSQQEFPFLDLSFFSGSVFFNLFFSFFHLYCPRQTNITILALKTVSFVWVKTFLLIETKLFLKTKLALKN